MKKCVLIGAGSRITFQYALPLYSEYRDAIKLVGILDTNIPRAEVLNDKLNSSCRVYSDFDQMSEAEKPDLIIVGSPDATHHYYINKALENGMEVISEKPISIDIEKIQSIIDAEKKFSKNILVTFNYRFTAFATRIKKMVLESGIGPIYSVHFEWHLDRQHGADYFRRWHREMKNSGGLLVHKSTHHFDLVNWLLGDEPVEVRAFGDLRVYGRKNAPFHGQTCRSCPNKSACQFYVDYSNDGFIKSSFFDCENIDSYFRDGCVYSDSIDIVDTASVQVRYAGGTLLSYSLNAYSPYEGYRMVITGENGRIEAEDFHGLVGYYKNQQKYSLKFYNLQEEEISINFSKQSGSHGGGDDRMMRMLFGPVKDDPYGHLASSKEAISSAMIGIAANRSIATGQAQIIGSLVHY